MKEEEEEGGGGGGGSFAATPELDGTISQQWLLPFRTSGCHGSLTIFPKARRERVPVAPATAVTATARHRERQWPGRQRQ